MEDVDVEKALKRALQHNKEIKIEIDRYDLDSMEKAAVMMGIAQVCNISAQMPNLKMAKAWTAALATYSRQLLDTLGEYGEAKNTKGG